MTDRYTVRAIAPAEFDAYTEVPAQAFNDAAWSAEGLEHERRLFEFDRSVAAFDGAAIVGTAGAYTFRLTVPGGVVNAAGVTFVSVLPSHRRRGILTTMMRHQLADIAERGEPVAALFSSESGIYGRYGYGCASGQLRLTIRRGEGVLKPPRVAAAHGPVRLRTGKPTDLRTALTKVYDAEAAHRPGMVARDDRWWDGILDDPEFARYGMSQQRCLLAEDDAGPSGYALYRTKQDWGEDDLPFGHIAVVELFACDGAAAAALWSDLLSRDLIGEVVARQRPVDEPLLEMLADRRRARTRLGDGLWIRLVDLPAAIAQRSYAAEADLVIEVADELVPANAGRWRLRCAGPAGGGTASCERTGADADIALPVAALGAAYLGAGTRLGALAAAGAVEERTRGAVARLSAAMYCDPAPWNPSIF